MDPTIASHRSEGNPFFGTQGKVLLVEPDPRDRKYYTEILRQRGFEVHACGSVHEGLARLESGPVDLIVLNQGSRAFEGRSLLERAIMIDRRLPVVVLTHAVDMSCYLEAMQLGAVDYIEKPLAPEEIARVASTHVRPRVVAA
ncbi:MAG: response regulator [Terriglobia bacterium]